MQDSTTTKNQITILDGIVFFGAIIYFILRIYFSSGQLTPDGINYLLQAQNFWEYKVNFPLGYPLVIKLLSFFTGSFFWSSKVVNILAYIGIILFSFKKKFFFPQTLFIFSFYPFLEFFTQTLSEPIYYFFNYIIIYYIYRITSQGLKIKYAIYLSLLFFMLVSFRFSGIFVFFSSLVYFTYLTYRNEISSKHLFLISFAMTLGVSSYLLINYFYSGFAIGQRNHLHIEPANLFTFLSEISLSTAKDFSFLNGILHTAILHKISFMNPWAGLALIVTGISIICKKRKCIDYFTIYLLLSFIVILTGVWYSYYTTRIDDTIRIKSTPYFYLLFLLLISTPKKLIIYLKIFAILIITLNIYTILKHSESIDKYYTKFESLTCSPTDKSVNIIYNGKPSEHRNNAAILMFKAISIDHNYKIFENKKDSLSNSRNCSVHSNDIIE